MNADYFRRLFAYSYWAHRRVWECVLLLDDEQYRRPCDYSIGSVHEQVVHTMGAEWLWLERLNGISPTAIPAAADYPTRETVRAKWDAVEADWRAYLERLTDDRLGEIITYTSISGRAQRQTPLWEILMQVVNHSTDHRAQMLARIHEVGGKTVEQDWIFYTWEHPG